VSCPLGAFTDLYIFFSFVGADLLGGFAVRYDNVLMYFSHSTLSGERRPPRGHACPITGDRMHERLRDEGSGSTTTGGRSLNLKIRPSDVAGL